MTPGTESVLPSGERRRRLAVRWLSASYLNKRKDLTAVLEPIEPPSPFSSLPASQRQELIQTILTSLRQYLRSLPAADQSRAITQAIEDITQLVPLTDHDIEGLLADGAMLVARSGMKPIFWLETTPSTILIQLKAQMSQPITTRELRALLQRFARRHCPTLVCELLKSFDVLIGEIGEDVESSYCFLLRCLADSGVDTLAWSEYLRKREIWYDIRLKAEPRGTHSVPPEGAFGSASYLHRTPLRSFGRPLY